MNSTKNQKAEHEETVKKLTFLQRIPARYILTFLGFSTFCNLYAQRVVMNVAVVAMINESAIGELQGMPNNSQSSDVCPDERKISNITYNYQNGEYVWSPSMQGVILGAFFYGFICTQLLGGWLIERIGAKNIFTSTILMSSILTILIPILADFGAWMVITLRVLTGLTHGVAYPAMFTLFSRWAPSQERSTLVAVCWTGNSVGTLISMTLTGYLCEYGFSGGWPSAFYVFGAAGCSMFIVLLLFLYDSPSLHPRISEKELKYIKENQYCPTSGQKKRIIPWKKILTSVPVWGVAIAKFSSAWAFFTLLTKLPAYLESVLHFPIYENGWMNAMFHFALGISTVLSGYLSDLLIKRKACGVTVLRKMFGSGGRAGPAICLLIVTFIGCDKMTVVILLTLSMALFGLIAGGDTPIIMDMANDYAGILFGLTNGFACLGGVLAPLVAGFVLDKDEGSLVQWNIVFYISCGLCAVGISGLICLASAEPQPWAVQTTKENKDDNNTVESGKL